MAYSKAMTLLTAVILFFCLPDTVVVRAADQEPSIRIARNTEPVLNLTKEQILAVKGYNQDFQIRKESDYLPALRKQYPFSPRQLPFAVIGDFNGDGRLDVVLQGHDKTSELLIAILSSSGGPAVVEIMRSSLIDPKTESYGEAGHVEYGLWTYLTFVPRGIVESPFSNKPLKLSTDAFQLNYFEKASVLYWLSGQRFEKYVISD